MNIKLSLAAAFALSVPLSGYSFDQKAVEACSDVGFQKVYAYSTLTGSVAERLLQRPPAERPLSPLGKWLLQSSTQGALLSEEVTFCEAAAAAAPPFSGFDATPYFSRVAVQAPAGFAFGFNPAAAFADFSTAWDINALSNSATPAADREAVLKSYAPWLRPVNLSKLPARTQAAFSSAVVDLLIEATPEMKLQGREAVAERLKRSSRLTKLLRKKVRTKVLIDRLPALPGGAAPLQIPQYVDQTGGLFNATEQNTALGVTSRGDYVQNLGVGPDGQPAARVNGLKTRFVYPDAGGSSPRDMVRKVRALSGEPGHPRYVVLDARGSGLKQGAAAKVIRTLGASRGVRSRIDLVRVIGDGFERVGAYLP